LPVPRLIGTGSFLYPFANGSKIALSKPWLKANIPLLTFSKQSLVSPEFFFDKEFSPSVPAFTLLIKQLYTIKNEKNSNNSFS